jgi:pre-rRNA-processing protein TSR1
MPVLWMQDPLILCIGPRRLKVNPIFSKQTRGGGKGANNLHKFERYLRHGTTNVATIYGPVVFGKQPCALLRETQDPLGKSTTLLNPTLPNHFRTEKLKDPQLVAMGAFLNSDITRIIAKRVILTGHPFKVHRKTSTVRYMFFNPGMS